ncbi:SLC5/6 family protein [Micromonospora profundi]|uniref:hypothetical protein n=1 Tax=Micromonospora profundi TaxID=1420889 RepID=UPI0037F8C4F7
MQRAVADSLEGVHAGLGETIGTTAGFGFAIALLVSGLASTSVGTQVILSFGIPFALIPVVAFTRRRDLMGNLVNHPLTTAAASLMAVLVVALNAFLLWQVVAG